ncbi:hypothetical protein SAMN06265795_12812 [Noviherbaspirillum humi]|uniref:Uncharacterized protein n=1 Tax=Noviherbaspirillum humi TaxID=1688639 RepID=A0A239LY16_9BURK|nr:hypothetical protein [Noviherbaspirillum humi]SNT35361.1 hypothetical protein SAMN06265795_12812 [Noviherbaspirillum humi]
MSNIIESRRIAEHLVTLAGLLDAEVIRANMLGLPLRRNLEREAREIRMLADKLWDAAVAIPLHADEAVEAGRSPQARPADEEESPARLALVRGA